MPARPMDAAQYSVVTTSKVMTIALGMFFVGLIASPDMQHISSKPMYPKKDDVAPRTIPPA